MRIYSLIVSAIAISGCWAGLPALAQSDPVEQIRRCSAEEDSVKRLECYDAIADVAQGRASAAAKAEIEAASTPAADAPVGEWRVSVDKSKVDDTTQVIAAVTSSDRIQARFETHSPHLILRCMENTTSAYIDFDGAFMADIGSYGDVTFRIDDAKAFEKSMAESTDHEALGLWSGGTAIPFIKSLIGGKKLLVRATPYNESSITFEFNISGVDGAVAGLRKACGW